MLAKLQKLSSFISRPNISMDSVCQFLATDCLDSCDPANVFICKLDPDGKVRMISTFGVSPEIHNAWDGISIEVNLPITDVLRDNQTIWLNDREDWVNQYPIMRNYPIPANVSTYISWPIQIPGAPLASIGVSCQRSHKPTPEAFSFIHTIGGLVGLYLSRLPQFRPGEDDKPSREFLSRRQNAILNLIREGLTNHEIAAELGFSESTIRQETMRIYQILKVANRKEASRIRFRGEI
jgi:DNA-binding CsgD family transcriptional regulator